MARPDDEVRALAGHFLLVYVTPEKMLQDGFMDRLAALSQKVGGLSLIAVDEAHCVSEWGVDFRPEYGRLGQVRAHPALASVPIVALTATAVPRVRQDIARSLALRAPFVSLKSFDKPNLAIAVARRPAGGAALDPVVELLRPGGTLARTTPATIVYCSTTTDTESVCAKLTQRLPGARVAFYHGKLHGDERTRVHRGFLTGDIDIVVATIAFGMGIDKPDIRVCVHYDAPRNIEAYYQHIGRAGRDGLPSRTLLLFQGPDFTQYNSDFYTRNLSEDAKRISAAATNALREYCENTQTCRRWQLLTYLGETPTFDKCGNCNNCKDNVANASDLTRDFSLEARAVLAMFVRKPTMMTSTLVAAIMGRKGNAHVAELGPIPFGVGAAKALFRTEHTVNFPTGPHDEAFWKEMLSIMKNAQLLETSTKRTAMGQAYELTRITRPGEQVLHATGPVMLPVPQSLRDDERKKREVAEARRARIIGELEAEGIDPAQIPPGAMDPGVPEDPVLRHNLDWARSMASLRARGFTARVDAIKNLFGLICEWRLAAARTLTMAPTAVLSDDLARRVALKGHTTAEAIRADGVRLPDEQVNQLAQVVADWLAHQRGPANPGGGGGGAANTTTSSSSSSDPRAPVRLPEGFFKALAPWKHTPYLGPNYPILKSGPNAGQPKTPSWEVSYNMYLEPRSTVATIAAARSVQPTTVATHLLQALTAGLSLDLSRAYPEWHALGFVPSIALWHAIDAVVTEQAVDIIDTKDVELAPWLMRSSHDQTKEAVFAMENQCRFYLAVSRSRIPVQLGAPDAHPHGPAQHSYPPAQHPPAQHPPAQQRQSLLPFFAGSPKPPPETRPQPQQRFNYLPQSLIHPQQPQTEQPRQPQQQPSPAPPQLAVLNEVGALLGDEEWDWEAPAAIAAAGIPTAPAGTPAAPGAQEPHSDQGQGQRSEKAGPAKAGPALGFAEYLKQQGTTSPAKRSRASPEGPPSGPNLKTPLNPAGPSRTVSDAGQAPGSQGSPLAGEPLPDAADRARILAAEMAAAAAIFSDWE